MTSSYANNIIFSMEEIKFDQDVLFLIRKLNKDLGIDFDKRLNEYGLTSQQGRALFFINKRVNFDHVDVYQVDLENRFELSKSTVSGLVKRMEKNGLINIVKDKNRSSLIPTEKSLQIIDKMHERRISTIEKLFKGIEEDRRKEIIEGIKKLISNIEEEDELCGKI